MAYSNQFDGTSVVHGPDWKWGIQDCGEGDVSTVVRKSISGLKEFGPQTVTVVCKLCTTCFLRKVPHNVNHVFFKP